MFDIELFFGTVCDNGTLNSEELEIFNEKFSLIHKKVLVLRELCLLSFRDLDNKQNLGMFITSFNKYSADLLSLADEYSSRVPEKIYIDFCAMLGDAYKSIDLLNNI